MFLILVTTAPAQVIIDTAGYTNRDRQVYGPAVRYIVNDTLRGIHIVWKDGYGEIRYNFRDRNDDWRWENGTPVSQYPRNLGCLDVNMTTGKAMIGADYILRGTPQISYFTDIAPGSGGFIESPIAAGYRHTLVATSRYGWPKFAALRNDSLFYRSPWSYKRLGSIGPFPGHNLASSKQSGRFGYIWTKTSDPEKGTLFLKETPNNGAHWYTTINLSDSVRSHFTRSLLGGCALYDSIRLHLVAGFYNGQNPNHSELWHYAKYDTPPWYLIHRFFLPDSADIGDDALACCRPSIGRKPGTREYYAIWEQFDPENIDPVTGLCRADIWACRSCDKTRPWGEPVRLTTPDESSKRFPFLAEVVDDTLHIICFADQVAGFWEQGQGPRTTNPVLYLRVPAELIPIGVNQPETNQNRKQSFQVLPTISACDFTIHTKFPVLFQVFDNSGRKVADLHSAGPVFRWGAGFPPGVYFIRSGTRSRYSPASVRVIKTR